MIQKYNEKEEFGLVLEKQLQIDVEYEVNYEVDCEILGERRVYSR